MEHGVVDPSGLILEHPSSRSIVRNVVAKQQEAPHLVAAAYATDAPGRRVAGSPHGQRDGAGRSAPFWARPLRRDGMRERDQRGMMSP